MYKSTIKQRKIAYPHNYILPATNLPKFCFRTTKSWLLLPWCWGPREKVSQRRACPALQDITRVLGDAHITVTAQITARGLGRDQEVEPRVCMHCFKYLIHHFHRDQCTLSTPQILHNHCFQFPLGITVIPRETEDNGYAKFWGVKRVHYGLGENGQYQLLIHPMTGQLWRFEIWHFHRRNGFSGSGQTEVFKKMPTGFPPPPLQRKRVHD